MPPKLTNNSGPDGVTYLASMRRQIENKRSLLALKKAVCIALMHFIQLFSPCGDKQT